MGFISKVEVGEFWINYDANEVKSRLKKLYKDAEDEGLSISKNLKMYEDSRYLPIKCLRNYFGDDSFVLLRYDSWILQFLLDNQNSREELMALYLHFWNRSSRKESSGLHGEEVWDYKNADKKRMDTALKFSDGTDPQRLIDNYDFSKRHELIAAFSESKIYIGWKENVPPPLQVAGIVHDRNLQATPTPCFSWSEDLELENPGTRCLFPWEEFTSASTPKYKPEPSIALFKELFVICNKEFMKKQSLYP